VWLTGLSDSSLLCSVNWFDPLKRAQGMAGFESFNKSACKRVPNLSGVGYGHLGRLRPKE